MVSTFGVVIYRVIQFSGYPPLDLFCIVNLVSGAEKLQCNNPSAPLEKDPSTTVLSTHLNQINQHTDSDPLANY
jgi:hypothetical protein